MQSKIFSSLSSNTPTGLQTLLMSSHLCRSAGSRITTDYATKTHPFGNALHAKQHIVQLVSQDDILKTTDVFPCSSVIQSVPLLRVKIIQVYQATYISVCVSRNLPVTLDSIIKECTENAKQILQSTEIAQQAHVSQEHCHVHGKQQKKCSAGLDLEV